MQYGTETHTYTYIQREREREIGDDGRLHDGFGVRIYPGFFVHTLLENDSHVRYFEPATLTYLLCACSPIESCFCPWSVYLQIVS